MFPGADGVRLHGRQHGGERNRKLDHGPAESKTPSMYRNSMRENREAPWPPHPEREGRWEKAMSSTPHMYDHGESYSGIIPLRGSTDEASEQRRGTAGGGCGGKAADQGEHGRA